MPTDTVLNLTGFLVGAEVAQRLGVSRAYVERLYYLGKLRAIRINTQRGPRLFRTVEVDQYLSSHPRLGTRVQAAS